MSAPAELERLLKAGEAVDYRHATATGRYLNDKERHFLATFQGQSGFYLYTPLELADGRYLFVNRGFVPYDRKDPATRPESLVEGEQTVTGLARAELTEKPSSLVPENDEAANIFYWKDRSRMAASVDLPADRVLPFFLDADSTPVAGGLPKGGVTQIDLRLDDALVVTASLRERGRASLVFDQLVMCGEHVLCEGDIRVGWVQPDAQGQLRPARMPSTIAQALPAPWTESVPGETHGH